MAKRIKTIKFVSTKRGERAYYWSMLAMRWLPIAVDDARLLLATGQAEPHLASMRAAGGVQ